MKPDFDIPPIIFGGTGYDSANQDMPSSLPERYEMGTQNVIGIAGLNASLRWIEEKGIKMKKKCLLCALFKLDILSQKKKWNTF